MYMRAEETLRRAAQPTVDAITRREKRVSQASREVLAEIRRHFYDPGYSVEQLRRNLRVRDWTLNCFGKEIGLTPWRVIHHCRMQMAARLLRDTHYPVADIGFFVGYNGRSAFVKAFRRWCGLRPATYRALARQLKARLPRPAEEIFTWAFWQKCHALELPIEQVRELADYLKLLRKLP